MKTYVDVTNGEVIVCMKLTFKRLVANCNILKKKNGKMLYSLGVDMTMSYVNVNAETTVGCWLEEESHCNHMVLGGY